MSCHLKMLLMILRTLLISLWTLKKMSNTVGVHFRCAHDTSLIQLVITLPVRRMKGLLESGQWIKFNLCELWLGILLMLIVCNGMPTDGAGCSFKIMSTMLIIMSMASAIFSLSMWLPSSLAVLLICHDGGAGGAHNSVGSPWSSFRIAKQGRPYRRVLLHCGGTAISYPLSHSLVFKTDHRWSVNFPGY